MIASIDPASPAAEAKLQPGDVILAYDGQAIDRSRQLPRLVADTSPDKTVKLSIWRDGKTSERGSESRTHSTRTVHTPPPPEPEKPKPPPTIDALGVKLDTFDRRFAQAILGARRGNRGGRHRGPGKQRGCDARSASRRPCNSHRISRGHHTRRGSAEGPFGQKERAQGSSRPGRARRHHPLCGPAH